MSTLEHLKSVYGAVAPLSDISKRYFNLGPREARRQALRNELPIPTFFMGDSTRSPLLVKVEDLATHIDSRHAASAAEWEKSRT